MKILLGSVTHNFIIESLFAWQYSLGKLTTTLIEKRGGCTPRRLQESTSGDLSHSRLESISARAGDASFDMCKRILFNTP